MTTLAPKEPGDRLKLRRIGGYAAIVAMCVGTAGNLALFPVMQSRFGELTDPAKIMMAVSAAPGLADSLP
jgi:hypothetical protein